MTGHVLDFSVKDSAGIIAGSDGQRYRFAANEWNADQSPSVGMYVDFEVVGQTAISIYPSIESAATLGSAEAEPSLLDRVMAVLKFQPGAFSDLASDPRSPKWALPVLIVVSLFGFWRFVPLMGGLVGVLVSPLIILIGMLCLLTSAGIMTFFVRKIVHLHRADIPVYLPALYALLFTWIPLVLGTTIPTVGFIGGLLYAIALQVFAVKDLYKVSVSESIIVWALSAVPAALIAFVTAIVPSVAIAVFVGVQTIRSYVEDIMDKIENPLRLLEFLF